MNCSRTLTVLAACVLALLGGAHPAAAAIVADWTGTGADTNFETVANWSTDPSAPVAADDTANFNSAAATAYTVTFNSDVTNHKLDVKTDKLIFDLAGTATGYTMTTFDVGGDGGESAELTLKNGTLTATGAGNTSCHIGQSGNGAVTVQDGATLATTGYILYMGQYGGTGKLTVTGAGSTVNAMYIYDGGGTGNVEVLNGATLTTSQRCYLAKSSASGTYTWLVDGADSTITLGSTMTVGTKGTATVTIQNGGKMTGTGSGGWSLTTDTGSSATINVGVTGNGTFDGKMTITFGDNGTGAFNIGAGGTVDIGIFTVGTNTTVTHAGTMSTFELKNKGTVTLNGGSITGTSSNYNLNIYDGGLLQGIGTLTPHTNRRVGNGGTISPGASFGTITIEGDLAMEARDRNDNLVGSNGTLALEFDASDCDLIEVTIAGKSIDLDTGRLEFTGSGLTGNETGQHDFLIAPTISNFAGLTYNDIDTVMSGLGFTSGNYSLDVVGTAGSGQALRLTYVPEPATLSLLAMGACLALVRRRRR